MKMIDFNGIPLFLNRRAGTRRISLRLNKNGDAVVTFPFFCSQNTVFDFVRCHQTWIANHRREKLVKKTFTDGLMIEILGQSLYITHQTTGHNHTHIEGNRLIVSGEASFIHRRVRDFIKQETLLYIQQKAQTFAAHLNEHVGHIRLKDTVSRWGSCSSDGNLNFSWRLALAPTYVLDYIIAHEVAHLKHLNHSNAFWKTVATFGTAQAAAEIWLRKNGSELQKWQR